MRKDEIVDFYLRVAKKKLLKINSQMAKRDVKFESKFLDEGMRRSEGKVKEELKKNFPSLSINNSNMIIDLIVMVLGYVVGLFIPTTFLLRLFIGAIISNVLLFITHGDVKYYIQDLILRFRFNGRIKKRIKLNINDFQPVAIGLKHDDKDDLDRVIITDLKNTGGLKSVRIYLSDSLTLNDMIFKYLYNYPQDFKSMVDFSVKTVMNDTLSIDAFSKNTTIKKSSEFNY